MKATSYTVAGFNVTSYGHGTAYLVEKDGRSFAVQGDDALTFESELEAARDAERPEMAAVYLSDMMDALGQEETAA
jgi:hypothetical protein